MLQNSYFISSLSHELRTPIHGIVGYSQLLNQTKLNKTQQGYVNCMNSCCLRLVGIVNDILDFSKLASGKAQINKEYFSLKEIKNEVDCTLAQKIKEKKQKIFYIFEEDIPEFLITDKQKLIQILINLISNANKFTPLKGRIIVTFSISKTKETTLVCSVEDNGIGISAEEQKELFNPFYQVQESMKEGTGLGLAICKKLCELLQGDISVDSEKNKGSIFSFFIKFENKEEYKFEEKKDINLKGKTVLFVDDNLDNRVIIGEMLFEFGMNPVICSSGKEALNLVNKKRYDFSFALLDICMPDMSGIELAKQIKDIIPEIPLIALSSLGEVFDSHDFERVLSKPIDKLKLLDNIYSILGNYSVEKYQLNPSPILEKIPLKDVKILITEDVSYNLEMLVNMVKSMGYLDVDTSTDGEEAINKLKEKDYDILLLDLKMPKVDGIQVAQYLKNREEKCPKIIVLTGSVLDSDKQTCKDLGIEYFLLKPISMVHLKNILNSSTK